MQNQVLNQDPSPLQQVDIPYPSIMPCYHIPCGWLTNVVTQKFGILAINSDLFWKNGWRSLLYFCSTFKISSLACSLSLSISFSTSSICSIASCYSFSSFSKFEEADASSGLEAGVGLAFFGFFAWGGSEDWCLGAMLGKKKSQESSQGRRVVLQAQRTQTFLFLFWNI